MRSLHITLLLAILQDASAWSGVVRLPSTLQSAQSVRQAKPYAPFPSTPFPVAPRVSTSSVSMSATATETETTLSSWLSWIDSTIVRRLIRLTHHIPAIASLAYFGAISMATNDMPMEAMMGLTTTAVSTGTAAAKAAAAASEPMMATLLSLLTRNVGMTSNAAFATLFPTVVTPAGFVFLIWPFIAVSQVITLALSILKPGEAGGLSQRDITSLSLANVAASLWLIITSNATPGNLPLGQVLILPLVPLLAGYTLRQPISPAAKKGSGITSRFVFRVFASFTTLASFLSLAVEISYGTRIPALLAKLPSLSFITTALSNLLSKVAFLAPLATRIANLPSLATLFTTYAQPLGALTFLGLTNANVQLPDNSSVKKSVNLLALTGILVQRWMKGGFSAYGIVDVGTLLLTLAVTKNAVEAAL